MLDERVLLVMDVKTTIVVNLLKNLATPISGATSFNIQLVERITMLIDSSNLSVRLLAEHLGINQRTLNRTCIECYRMLPNTLIKYLRIELVDAFVEQGFCVETAIEKSGFKTVRQYKQTVALLKNKGLI